ncbi:MAG: hypothetical protein ACOCTI_06215 [Phycisphaeraceae bacterium]
MAEASDGQVACPHCGKEYRWKPEIAGRKVRCKCGHKFRLPQEPGGAPEPLDGGQSASSPPPPAPRPRSRPSSKPSSSGGDANTYELALPEDGEDEAAGSGGESAGAAAEQHCPGCNRVLKPGAVICINCGYNLAAGEKLSTDIGAEEIIEGESGVPAAAAPGEPEDEAEAAAPFWKRMDPKLLLALGLFALTAIILLFYLF